MSAPLVAAMAALALEVDKDLEPKELKEILMKSGSPSDLLKGKIKSGRLLSAPDVIEKATPRGFLSFFP